MFWWTKRAFTFASRSTPLNPPCTRRRDGQFKIGIGYFAPEPGADSCMKGLFDGLKEMGFVEGQNLTVQKAHANGEISNITAIMQNFDNSDVDLIVPMTTPCLTAACSTVKNKPVVFTYVYDPIAAGAGKTMEDHQANVTGVGSFPPVEDTIKVIQELVPGRQDRGDSVQQFGGELPQR